MLMTVEQMKAFNTKEELKKTIKGKTSLLNQWTNSNEYTCHMKGLSKANKDTLVMKVNELHTIQQTVLYGSK